MAEQGTAERVRDRRLGWPARQYSAPSRGGAAAGHRLPACRICDCLSRSAAAAEGRATDAAGRRSRHRLARYGKCPFSTSRCWFALVRAVKCRHVSETALIQTCAPTCNRRRQRRNRAVRARRERRGAITIEILGHRCLLDVGVRFSDIGLGQVAFAGNLGSSANDSLRLWAQSGYLAHNPTDGQYADPTDLDPEPGYAELYFDTGSDLLIDVRLSNGSNVFRLDNTTGLLNHTIATRTPARTAAVAGSWWKWSAISSFMS